MTKFCGSTTQMDAITVLECCAIITAACALIGVGCMSWRCWFDTQMARRDERWREEDQWFERRAIEMEEGRARLHRPLRLQRLR